MLAPHLSATTILLSVFIDVAELPCTNRIIKYLSFCHQLISLSIVSSRFIHVTVWGRIIFSRLNSIVCVAFTFFIYKLKNPTQNMTLTLCSIAWMDSKDITLSAISQSYDLTHVWNLMNKMS
ncbi:hypothetical protein HJG60_008274 [Phyllostomus discolor]|uniref:Uncharacterized protein n=1 Tax=Phyllostomus discolor TaxID=89673 RepID=A0A833Z6T8_9CHIR|nr:hypothetical protein HJG60_008274 [Phyllostomus discolor]